MKGQRRQELVRRKTVPAASQRAGVADQKNNSLSSAPYAWNETHRYQTMMSYSSIRSRKKKKMPSERQTTYIFFRNVI